MNAYELAEITAALAHHELSDQCHIVNVSRYQTVIYKETDPLAIIRERIYGDYIADGYHAYTFGNTRTQALANLLDTTYEYRDNSARTSTNSPKSPLNPPDADWPTGYASRKFRETSTPRSYRTAATSPSPASEPNQNPTATPPMTTTTIDTTAPHKPKPRTDCRTTASSAGADRSHA